MYVKVRVIAGAKREEFIQESDDHFVIRTTEPAQANRANKRIIELISHHFSGKRVRIINGHHSPGKLLAVDD
ncbi:MAG: uncharacterized protein QG589_236 [Patescibacteria group bacterium]|nr:uncharacterized protein [Patescibacteria group bacterium]